MKHRVCGYKLHVTSAHKKALLSNLMTSLFMHERIKTTVLKAKALSQRADKMITLAKKQSLHARRLAARSIKNKDVLRKLFSDIGARYANRNGGYTRVIKLSGWRPGDGASMALIELTERKVIEEDSPKKGKKKEAKADKKAAGAKAEESKSKKKETKKA